MLFDFTTLAVLGFATGLSAAPYEHGSGAHNHVARQTVQAFDIGTFTTNTDPTPQNLTIVLQSANQGSQPLGGGVIQAVLSSADVIANQAGFTQVSCSFTSAQGPPDDNTDPPSPTCDLDTKLADASTEQGASNTVTFDATNTPGCVFCQLS